MASWHDRFVERKRRRQSGATESIPWARVRNLTRILTLSYTRSEPRSGAARLNFRFKLRCLLPFFFFLPPLIPCLLSPPRFCPPVWRRCACRPGTVVADSQRFLMDLLERSLRAGQLIVLLIVQWRTTASRSFDTFWESEVAGRGQAGRKWSIVVFREIRGARYSCQRIQYQIRIDNAMDGVEYIRIFVRYVNLKERGGTISFLVIKINCQWEKRLQVFIDIRVRY